MKILINSHSGIGGISRSAIEMSKEIIKYKNHSLVIITTNGFKKNRNISSYSNVTIYSLPKVSDLDKVKSVSELYEKNRDNIIEMKEIIQRENPDIIVCAGTFYHPWFLFKAAQETKKPFLIRYDGIIEKEEDKKIWLDIGKEFVNRDFYYIFPSFHAKKTIEDIYNINLDKSYVLHSGISNKFFNSKRKSSGSKFRIGFVGRMARIKNCEFCFDFASSLNLKNNGFELYIVTDLNHAGEDNKRLLYKLKDLGVKLNNKMNSANLSRFYRRMNLIISPSHFETYGYVPLEALASGTIPLISKTMGVREVFERIGLEEMVTDFNDLDAVLYKIKKIKSGNMEVGDKERYLLKKDYSWSSTMKNYFDIFSNIVKK
jgi:glycosyltransferase involved in cell wall biosynthesis